MIIAVNTRLLLKDRLEGIGWFTYETLKRITRDHPEHQFIFIFDRPYHDSFIFSPNIIPVVIGPQARHPFLFLLWFEFSVSKILKKFKADIFLSPDGYLSLSTKIPSLAVIHDLNFEHYPKDLPWIITRYYRYFFPRFARKAKRIATVSEFSAEDIVKQYGIERSRIDVVYNGANEEFRPLTPEEKKQAFQRFSGGKPYFIFVGSLHPRKNLINLFKAFDIFRQDTGSDIKLLVVGAKKWWTPRIRDAYMKMKFRDEVIFAGRLNEFDLNLAMGAAVATTYVSYFEGFGIPLIESFRCHVPVIAANVTSLPEVAGDAALLCNPFNPTEIAAAMKQISENENLRNNLIEKGKKRAEIFNWNRTAQLLWESIMKTMGEK